MTFLPKGKLQTISYRSLEENLPDSWQMVTFDTTFALVFIRKKIKYFSRHKSYLDNASQICTLITKIRISFLKKWTLFLFLTNTHEFGIRYYVQSSVNRFFNESKYRYFGALSRPLCPHIVNFYSQILFLLRP